MNIPEPANSRDNPERAAVSLPALSIEPRLPYSPPALVVGVTAPFLLLFGFLGLAFVTPFIAGLLNIDATSAVLNVPLAATAFLIMSLLLAFVSSRFQKRPMRDVLGLRNFSWRGVFWGIMSGVLVWLLATGISVAYVLLNPEVSGNGNTTSQSIASLDVLQFLLISVLFVSLITPIVEELFFRGVMLRSLVQDSTNGFAKFFSILITAVAFGLIHFQGWGTASDLFAMLIPAIVGFIAGLLTLKHRSIYPAIIFHAVYNAIVVSTLAIPMFA